MAHKLLVAAFGMAIAMSPAWAQDVDANPDGGAPAAGPDARYCMNVEPATGSRIETIQCFTRAEWAELEVDLDAEWPKEGVRVIA